MMDQDGLTTALLRAIEFSDEPMVLSDVRLPDTPMIAVNAAFERLSGFGRAELIGRNCRILQGEDADPATRARIRRCVQSGQGCIEWIVNHRKNGQAFWNLLFISPVADRDGRPRYYLGNQLDITQGLPEWLGEVTFGRAHMSAEIQAEFHGVLQDFLRSPAPDAGGPGLHQMIVAARRLAELTTQLDPGAAPVPPPGAPPLPVSLGAQARNAPGGPAAS